MHAACHVMRAITMQINPTDRYEYIEITLDRNLNLFSEFQKLHKIISWRIKLLARLCMNISPCNCWNNLQSYNLANIPILQQYRNRNFKLMEIEVRKSSTSSHEIFQSIWWQNKCCAIEVFKFLKLLHQEYLRNILEGLTFKRTLQEANQISLCHMYGQKPPEKRSAINVFKYTASCNLN